jgi:hypothetical protein
MLNYTYKGFEATILWLKNSTDLRFYNQQFAYFLLNTDNEHKHFPHYTNILWLDYHNMLKLFQFGQWICCIFKNKFIRG